MSAISECLPKQFIDDSPEAYHSSGVGLLIASLMHNRGGIIHTDTPLEQSAVTKDVRRFYKGVYGKTAYPFMLSAYPKWTRSPNCNRELSNLADYAAKYESDGLVIIPDATIAPRPKLVESPLLQYLSECVLEQPDMPNILVVGLHASQSGSARTPKPGRFNPAKLFLDKLSVESELVGDKLIVEPPRQSYIADTAIDEVREFDMSRVHGRALRGCPFVAAAS